MRICSLCHKNYEGDFPNRCDKCAYKFAYKLLEVLNKFVKDADKLLEMGEKIVKKVTK